VETTRTFASKSLAEHLARGAAGAIALATSFCIAPEHSGAAFALLPVALLALRGCPTCWTVGLFQTLAGRDAACRDGRCAAPDRETT